MNEEELIILMLENNFSTKQIARLKKLSRRYSWTLYDTVIELGRRFPRSLFMHVFVFIIIFTTYINDSQQKDYDFWHSLLLIGTLCVAYVILDLFAPLIQGYKAWKVIKKSRQKQS